MCLIAMSCSADPTQWDEEPSDDTPEHVTDGDDDDDDAIDPGEVWAPRLHAPRVLQPSISGERFAMGDFNRDGRSDLVTAGGVVFIAKADGSFVPQEKRIFPPNGYGVYVNARVVDMNGDGLLDVLGLSSGAYAERRVFLALGDGAGGFTTKTIISSMLYQSPYDIAAGDFDGDGVQDFVYTQNANLLNYRYGAGQVNYSGGSSTHVEGAARDVVPIKLNADATTDLLVISHRALHAVFVRASNYADVITTYILGATDFKQLTVDDVNGDGHPDAVVSAASPPSLRVIFGKAGGQFNADSEVVLPFGTTYPVFHIRTAAGGQKEFYVAEAEGDTVSVYRLNDARFIRNREIVVGGALSQLAVDSFMGDGNPTLIARDRVSRDLFVLAAMTGQRHLSLLTTPAHGQQLVLTRSAQSRRLASTGTAASLTHAGFNSVYGLDAPMQVDLPGVPLSLLAADVNGDAAEDLIVSHGSAMRPTVLINKDNKFASLSSAMPYKFHHLAAGDFNGDGHQDLVGVAASEYLHVGLGRGDGTFDFSFEFRIGGAPTHVAVTRLNNDAFADLVVLESKTAELVTLTGQGNGRFVESARFKTVEVPTGLDVGDLNGDGRTDAVVASASKNIATIWLGQGDGHFTGRVDFPARTRVLGVARITKLSPEDGPSLITGDAETGQLRITRYLANGFATSSAAYSGGGEVSDLEFIDVNNDGLLELLVADKRRNKVHLIVQSRGNVAGQACAYGFHLGGNKECVPIRSCASQFHDGGDGSCVMSGSCANGFHDDGRALEVCLPLSQCAERYHDGGNGSCILITEGCLPNYRDGGDGKCVPNGRCSPAHHDLGWGYCLKQDRCPVGYLPDATAGCKTLTASCAAPVGGQCQTFANAPEFVLSAQGGAYAYWNAVQNSFVHQDPKTGKSVRIEALDDPYSETLEWTPSLSSNGMRLVYQVADAAPGENTIVPGNAYYLDLSSAAPKPVWLGIPDGVKGSAYHPVISADGKVVAYEHYVVSTEVRRMVLYFPEENRYKVITPFAGAADWHSRDPSLSADGRFLVFASDGAYDGVTHERSRYHVFLYDVQTDELHRISVERSSYQYVPRISADGLHIAYSMAQYNTTDRKTYLFGPLHIYHRATDQREKIDVFVGSGFIGLGSRVFHAQSFGLSADGRNVIFSATSDLLLEGIGTKPRFWLYDTQLRRLQRLTDSDLPQYAYRFTGLSADGRVATFHQRVGNTDQAMYFALPAR